MYALGNFPKDAAIESPAGFPQSAFFVIPAYPYGPAPPYFDKIVRFGV